MRTDNKTDTALAAPQPAEPVFFGVFDGLRGGGLYMSLADAHAASHQGDCHDDVCALLRRTSIVAQLDAYGADFIREAVRESGGWDEEEMADDDRNRERVVWMAACDIRENQQEARP